MAFLELNGLTIPVRDTSAREEFVDVGMRARAFDGTLLTSRRARKRMWRGRTHPLVELDAKAIEGVIAGLGHAFPYTFTDSAKLTPDFFSSKGLPATSDSVGSIRWGTGADGDPVIDSNGISESKYGDGAIAVEVATTNEFPNDAADMEVGTADFAGVAGGVIAVDTANYLQGAQSLKVTTANANDGVENTPVVATATASVAYTATAYVKCGAARNIRLRLLDGNANSTDADYLLVADTWTRLSVTHTLAGAGPGNQQAKLQILDLDAGGTIFFTDAWQLEQGSVSTSWRDPASGTRTLGIFKYPAEIIDPGKDLTINFWAKSPTAAPAATGHFFALRDVPIGPVIQVRRNTSGDLQFVTITPPLVTDNLSTSFGFNGDWHMITAVIRFNPETGESIKSLYADGALLTSNSPSVMPDLTTIVSAGVGNSGAGTSLTDSIIDDVVVLPWAATLAQITAWFNMGVAMPALPAVRLTGDVIPETSVLVDGRVSASQFVGAVVNGSYRTNAREVDFVLEEI